MNTITMAPRASVVDIFAPSLVRDILFVLAGVCVLTLSAKIQVPFFGVPMTLQTLAVLALAGLARPKLALTSIGAYLAASLVLPVTAHPAGLFGPTGGYLLGFVLATAVVSYAATVEARGVMAFMTRLALMTFGMILIYAVGVPWLATFTGGYESAWAVGVAPFLLKDVVCVLLAAAIVQGLWQVLPQRLK